MRKALIIGIMGLALSFFSIVGLSGIAKAQFTGPLDEVCTGEATDSDVCKQKDNTENPVAEDGGILVTVLGLMSFAVGVTSVVMVILGGFKYVVSNGDSNAVNSAKNTILYAIIGLVVFLSSQLIIRLVISEL